jgi:hypothetical protein
LTFNFIDYLAAKKSVDDRALNRHVLKSLVQHLPPIDAQGLLYVLEIAAGIGTMIERLVQWNILARSFISLKSIWPDLFQNQF